VQRERGTDLTIFSPRAAGMGHHLGDATTSEAWASACNDLTHRVCSLFPKNFIGVAMLPQSARVSPKNWTAWPVASPAEMFWPDRPAATVGGRNPDHERQHAEGDHRVGTAAGKAQYRLQRVERARPDVAEDHSQRREAERR
jgi:hypothetical protein